MEEKVIPSYLALPYATEDSTRKAKFSEEMEIAALLCAAEADRRKKSRFLRGGTETLTFLSKLHYPMWAVPWENSSMLIDGMGIVVDHVLYSKLPDVEAFIEHLKRSTSVHELFKSTIRSHSDTFLECISQTEFPVEGRITGKETLEDIFEQIKESKTQASSRTEQRLVLVQPIINEERAVEIRRNVAKHHNKLQSEIKGLQLAVKTVTEETRKHEGKLNHELEVAKESYEAEISKTKTEVEGKVGRLAEERDGKIEKVTSTYKKEVEARFQERKKCEQELLRIEQRRNEYEKRKELRKRKNDEVGEARWNTRIRHTEDQISAVKAKIKALSDFIERANKETDKTAKTLHNNYQRLIEEEEVRISNLVALRDSKISSKEQEIDELHKEMLIITEKIERLIDFKRERSLKLREGVIPWKIQRPVLIRVPFYIILYTSEKDRRFLVRSPVVARDHKGFTVKIRKIGGLLKSGPKMSTLLKSRSKTLEKLMKSFEEKTNLDTTAQRALSKLGITHNILTSKGFKEKINKGLNELEAERWLKPEEKQLILEIYAGAAASENHVRMNENTSPSGAS
ncbi:MAG: hypothetical protein JSV64_06170 [Candidatus Bathyarchaeota archaeon]|nr:MAG: hypothetical protein JSV64_06170 [Candidatus Bathyarchaeota archaeon]